MRGTGTGRRIVIRPAATSEGGPAISERRLLPNTVGTPGQTVVVNDAGTAVEYVDAPSGSGATTAAELEVDDSAYPGITAANQEEFNDAAYAGLIDHGTAIADLGNRTNDTETAISGLEATRVTYTELTTAVDAKVADAINDGTTTVAPSQNAVFDALALKAPLASPTFTGTPEAPTASAGTNTTQIATTAMVQSEVALLVPKARTVAGLDLSADRTASALRNALGLGGSPGVAGQWRTGAHSDLMASQAMSQPYLVARLAWLDEEAVDRLAIISSGSSASSTARLGIYQANDTAGRPGTQLLAPSGTLSGASPGLKEATVAWTPSTAGWYWMVAQIGGNTFGSYGCADAWSIGVNTGSPASPYTSMYVNRADAALPSSLAGTSWTLNTGPAPGVIVRKA